MENTDKEKMLVGMYLGVITTFRLVISLPTSFMYPSLAPQQPWSLTASALRYALHCAR